MAEQLHVKVRPSAEHTMALALTVQAGSACVVQVGGALRRVRKDLKQSQNEGDEANAGPSQCEKISKLWQYQNKGRLTRQ